MVFRYTKRRLKMHLTVAIAFSLLGCISLFFSNAKNWFSYAYLPIGILYFYIYLYDKKRGALVYNVPIITQQSLPKKHFDLSKLDTLKKDYKGITLLSKTQKKMVIEPSIIESNDLEKLKQLLAKYEAKKKYKK